MFRIGAKQAETLRLPPSSHKAGAELTPPKTPDAPGLGLTRPVDKPRGGLLGSLSRFRTPVMAALLGSGLLLPGTGVAGARVGAGLEPQDMGPAPVTVAAEQNPRALYGDIQLTGRGDLVSTSGASLVRMLSTLANVSEQDTNPFRQGLTAAQQKGLFDLLQQALVAPQQSQAPGTPEQVLQASAAVLLLDLARATADPVLKSEIIKAYGHGLEQAGGVNRRFMILDLERVAPELGPDARRLSHAHIAEVAPSAPPYASWFANGNDTVRVHYYVGAGFWDEESRDYAAHGWSVSDQADGTRLMKKSITFEPEQGPAVKTHFEVVMHNGSSALFSKMNDPAVQMVVYSGHASYGRHVPQQLGAGTDLVGDKVFMGLQCGGKGTQDPVADKYPELIQIQTKNSSYGYQDRATFRAVIDGIAHRSDWAGALKGRSFNYYGPADRLSNERALDRDQDGRADLLDRVASHGLERPAARAVKDQLTPVATATAAQDLDGTALHAVVLRLHRMLGYTDYADHLQDQTVLDDGFYDGGVQDPLLRVDERKGPDGAPQYRLSVNKAYAGASEEVLGAAIHFELGRRFAALPGHYSPQEATAAGLLMATKALKVDNDTHDTEAFDALTRYAGIEGVSLRDARRAHAADDDSAGNRAQIDALLKELGARGVKLP